MGRGFESFARLLDGPWPDCAGLNALLGFCQHPVSGVQLRFVPQDDALATDGLHYETRILQRGLIATRTDNWHDLFNALCWCERRPLKLAVNTAYVAELERLGSPNRSRHQAALTHFDEAGAVVFVRDEARLRAWDEHDWETLFLRRREQFDEELRVVLFGHALLEHCLVPALYPVAKCVGVAVDNFDAMSTHLAEFARALARGDVLRDPQELRPLPLSGLPGWDPAGSEADFYRAAPCFRPLRQGRRYPALWRNFSLVGTT